MLKWLFNEEVSEHSDSEIEEGSMDSDEDDSNEQFKLPVEVILLIISRLSSIEDLKTCMLLSKEIRDLMYKTPEIMIRLKLRLNNEVLPLLREKGKFIKNVDCYEKDCFKDIQLTPNLECLNIEVYDDPAVNQNIEDLGLKFFDLKYLQLSSDGNNQYLSQLISALSMSRKLKRIEILMKGVDMNFHIDFAKFPNLEILWCPSLRGSSGHFTKLTKLSVFDFDVANIHDLKLPNLKILNLYNFYMTEQNTNWRSFPENAPNIEKLNVQSIFNNDQNVFIEILKVTKFWKKLKEFKISCLVNDYDLTVSFDRDNSLILFSPSLNYWCPNICNILKESFPGININYCYDDDYDDHYFYNYGDYYEDDSDNSDYNYDNYYNDDFDNSD